MPYNVLLGTRKHLSRHPQAPVRMPFDVDVPQETPLDSERDLLADNYKKKLRAKLITPKSSNHVGFMEVYGKVPT